ncbi:MAG: peptidoglycan-binding domain-containing protein [Pseudomonadota bacterium]
MVLIASNALWEQDSHHPAPLWGGDPSSPIVATHAPLQVVRKAPVRNVEQSDPMVLKVQTGLLEAGYFAGDANGILEDDTAVAIRRFEQERGLPVTGRPSLGLLAAISEPLPEVEPENPGPLQTVAAPATALSEPASPTPGTVPQIQAALNAAGYGPLEVDGVMGPRTKDALAQFARTNGLSPQGVTPAILDALAGHSN